VYNSLSLPATWSYTPDDVHPNHGPEKPDPPGHTALRCMRPNQ